MLPQAAIVGEPLDGGLRRIGLEIQLGAIAGRQNRGFMHPPAAGQVGQRPAQFLGMERHMLANRKRRRAVIDAESKKRHELWGR